MKKLIFLLFSILTLSCYSQFIVSSSGGIGTQEDDELIKSTNFANESYWQEAINVTSKGESTFTCSNTGGMGDDPSPILTLGNIYDAHIAGNLSANTFEFRANDNFKTITAGDFNESFEFTAGGSSSHLYLRITNGAATVTFTTLSIKLSTTAEWVSPTGKENDAWTDAANIYDGNVLTSGKESTNGQSVTLTIASVSCSKIRLNAGKVAGGQANLLIEVYYGGAFHEIHSGTVTEDTWQEINIGSTQNVTKARIATRDGINTEVWEFEFYKIL